MALLINALHVELSNVFCTKKVNYAAVCILSGLKIQTIQTNPTLSYLQTLRLNSSENYKLVTLASTIGIPSAPALSALSDNFTMVSICLRINTLKDDLFKIILIFSFFFSFQNTMLRHMLEGLQLHKDLLNHVLPRLEVKDMVIDLTHDLNDLSVQVLKVGYFFSIFLGGEMQFGCGTLVKPICVFCRC